VSRVSLILSLIFVGLVLLAFVIWPEVDLVVSGLFAAGRQGFYLQDNPILNGLTKTVFYGARVLGGLLMIGAGVSLFRQKVCLGVPTKAWIFLLLCLVVGPGLLANVVFKDHWGRARPRSVEIFGGTKPFTPAAVLSDACTRNCSFVSGDAAFGFFLPSFAYVVAPRRRRRVFWGGLGVGAVLASARIILGAHFLSDVVYALVLVLSASAALHALFYNKEETARCWKEWLPFLVNRR